MKSFHIINKKIDNLIKSSYSIEKNEIKKSVTFFLTLDNFESFYNATVR